MAEIIPDLSSIVGNKGSTQVKLNDISKTDLTTRTLPSERTGLQRVASFLDDPIQGISDATTTLSDKLSNITPDNIKKGYDTVISTVKDTQNNKTAEPRTEILDGDQILEKLNFQPEINLLSSVQSPTYFWRLFMADESAAINTVADINDRSTVTLIETGVTGTFIKSVSIESSIGSNFKIRNTTATSFNIEIQEIGVKFFDDILLASKKLNIKNYFKSPYYLELKLRGLDDETGRQGEISRHVWRVMFIDVKTNLDGEKTTHSIKAIPSVQIAHFNQLSILQDPVSVKGETIGDILQEVFKSMNNSVKMRYGYELLKYKVSAKPYDSDSGMSVKNPLEHSIKPESLLENSQRNSEGVQISRGTDIGNIIERLFANSETAVAGLSLIQDSEALKNKDISKSISMGHKIETKVNIGDYDPITGDYEKEIEYIIIPHSVLRLLPETTTADDTIKNNTLSQDKLKYAIRKNLFVKQYDYIFTGKNTEVLAFDIQTNFQYAIASSIFGGMLTYESSTVGKKYNPVARNRLKNDLLRLTQINNKITEIKNKVENAPAPNNEEEKKKLEQAVNESNREVENYEKDKKLLIDEISKQQRELKELYKKQGFVNTLEQSNVYAEDLTEESVKNLNPLPISVFQTGEDPLFEVQDGVEASYKRGKSVYGTLLNQLYSTGVTDGSLQRVEMDIRGDPYWIGLTNLEDNKESTRQQPNFFNGEHMFVFTFKIPQGFNEDTGVLNIGEAFSGFFATMKVTSTFDGGVFTQRLEAIRIPTNKLLI